jgi:hypothetical protein
MGRNAILTIEDFEFYVLKTDTCWLWCGAIAPTGHGRVTFKGKKHQAHRVAKHLYEGFNLDSENLICHKLECPNKHCINPNHTYEGDYSDNNNDTVLAGNNIEASKTYCSRGHEYTKENTRLYLSKQGSWKRKCKLCVKINNDARFKNNELD